MRNTIWTDDLTKALSDLVTEKHSAAVIAKKLKADYGVRVTRNAVIGKCFRMGFALNGATKPAESRSSRPRKKPSAPGVIRAKTMWGRSTYSDETPVGLLAGAAFLARPKAPPHPKTVTPVYPFLMPDGQLYNTLNIGQKQCKWIVEGHGKSARYCGHEAVLKRSWCGHHMTKLLATALLEAAL